MKPVIIESVSEMIKGKPNLSNDYNKWTVKQLKAYCVEKNIKVPSTYRKVQIINLIKDFDKSK